jgi:hypothetical protein
MEKQIINIPLEIPKALIDAGAIELYAKRFANWTPEIDSPIESEDALNVKHEKIPNPVSAFEASVEYIRNFVKDGYKSILTEMAEDAARKNALDNFQKLFNE